MPFPNPFLFPSPYLLPGGPGPFADVVVDVLAPWDDANGFWSGYNSALGLMFEPVYDLVADTGDPDQTIVATLGASLSTSAPVTALNVQAVSQAIATDTEVTLAFNTNVQSFSVSLPVSVGDAVITVASTTPNFAYPVGTPVQLAYFPGWSSLLDPVNCPDQFLPYLAQFNGTVLPVGGDALSARAKITNESGLARGTYSAIISAIQRNLTGTQSVVLQERLNPTGNPDAYWFMVIVRPEEVVSVSALTDDVNLVKPGGVQWTLIQTDGWIISQMEVSEVTLSLVEGDFVTLTGLELDRPGT